MNWNQIILGLGMILILGGLYWLYSNKNQSQEDFRTQIIIDTRPIHEDRYAWRSYLGRSSISHYSPSSSSSSSSSSS
jgi:hypothetical protein